MKRLVFISVVLITSLFSVAGFAESNNSAYLLDYYGKGSVTKADYKWENGKLLLYSLGFGNPMVSHVVTGDQLKNVIFSEDLVETKFFSTFEGQQVLLEGKVTRSQPRRVIWSYSWSDSYYYNNGTMFRVVDRWTTVHESFDKSTIIPVLSENEYFPIRTQNTASGPVRTRKVVAANSKYIVLWNGEGDPLAGTKNREFTRLGDFTQDKYERIPFDSMNIHPDDRVMIAGKLKSLGSIQAFRSVSCHEIMVK